MAARGVSSPAKQDDNGSLPAKQDNEKSLDQLPLCGKRFYNPVRQGGRTRGAALGTELDSEPSSATNVKLDKLFVSSRLKGPAVPESNCNTHIVHETSYRHGKHKYNSHP